jgi:hypothetical protein
LEVYEFGDGRHLGLRTGSPLFNQINSTTDYPVFVTLVQAAMDVGIAAVFLRVGLWLMSSISCGGDDVKLSYLWAANQPGNMYVGNM